MSGYAITKHDYEGETLVLLQIFISKLTIYIYIRFIDNEIVVNDKTARSTIRGEKSYKCSQDGIITNIFNKVICLSLNKLLAVHIVTDSFFAFSHISRNLQQVHYDEVSKCPLPNST